MLETASTVAGYITLCDPDASGNPLYLGRALIGSASSQAVWQIRKLTYTGGGFLTSILFANGSLAYSAIWDDRATLTYS